VKETQTGKLIKEWETALASANSTPELIDMAPSISSMLAVKDDEELVRCICHCHVHEYNVDIACILFVLSEKHTDGSKSDFDATHTLHRGQAGDDTGQGGQDNA
jgi:nucleosome binding factor SPN SPT16 subunit